MFGGVQNLSHICSGDSSGSDIVRLMTRLLDEIRGFAHLGGSQIVDDGAGLPLGGLAALPRENGT